MRLIFQKNKEMRLIGARFIWVTCNTHADEDAFIILLLKLFLIKFVQENNNSQQLINDKISKIAIFNFLGKQNCQEYIPCF